MSTQTAPTFLPFAMRLLSLKHSASYFQNWLIGLEKPTSAQKLGCHGNMY